MRKFKSAKGELYLSNDTRLVQKVHLKSYLKDEKDKVERLLELNVDSSERV